MIVAMKYCRFETTPDGAVTIFPDGSVVHTIPHDTHHYHVVSHRCGYGDDILRYAQEHDFAHNLVAEWFHNCGSQVLQDLAHGKTPRFDEAIAEEALAQLVQRWVRANERPILADVDWDGLREWYLHYLG